MKKKIDITKIITLNGLVNNNIIPAPTQNINHKITR
jgi:hypothetical protein